ncbi:hypothetical protein, partial [Aliidiomarina sp.]|uniref:hypothetical protein n=1 Tax=Aliidiomarina sp. TaxID=1872439 RepID=UPI003A4E3DA2
AQVPTQITWLDILLKNVARLSGARSEVRILHASFLLSTAFEKFFYFYMLANYKTAKTLIDNVYF